MCADVRDNQFIRCQHDRHVLRPAEFADQFGMSGESGIGKLGRFLVYRQGNDGSGFTSQCGVGGGHNVFPGRQA